MFTGIVREIGRVTQIYKMGALWRIGIETYTIYHTSNVGDSISVNGVCLTVVEKRGKLLFVEAVPPTLSLTNLKRVRMGSLLNLEPALSFESQLGGHFVLGHIDCESPIQEIRRKKDYYQFKIHLPQEFRKFIVRKGSVAVDGISLTVQEILSNSFVINLIPYTYNHTNLRHRKVGDWVNIEFDYLAKVCLNSLQKN